MKHSLPKFSKSSYIILASIFLCFFVSLMIWLADFPGIRRTFVFHASDSDSLMLETRYVPVSTGQGKIKYYIEELLLGPVSEHCNPVFAKGTKLESCFLRGKTLYVNVSADMLKADPFETDFTAQINLFKTNILNNFRNIQKIEFFIDGSEPVNYKN